MDVLKPLKWIAAMGLAAGLLSAQENPIPSVLDPRTPVRTITVGGDTSEIPGFTSRSIQTAADALRESGGVIRLSGGIFDIQAPVSLYSNQTLAGSPSTVLKKCPGFRTRLVTDADYGELYLEVQDPSGFAPDMAVQVFDEDQHSGWAVTTAVITQIQGNMLFIDRPLERDYRSDRGGTVSNACSVISAVGTRNIVVSGLTVDGARESNDVMDGCRGGGIYLHRTGNALVERVTVRRFNGDGISWQITEDVTVRGCTVTECSNAGLHPGTGSPRTLIDSCDCSGNDRFGLFVCWRVRNGQVRNSRFSYNGLSGICTGHKDTDMLFEGNHIFENKGGGVHFRPETQSNAPHRNVFRGNRVENNVGYGFSFDSPARDIVLDSNIIRNPEGGQQKAAVRVGRDGLKPSMVKNRISGHPEGEIVFRNNTGGI